jgi:hypothetical protein
MVRTHPTTGWKTLFAGGLHCRRVNGVTEWESKELLEKILRLVADNHDLQVRIRWNTPSDFGKATFAVPVHDFALKETPKRPFAKLF